MAKARDIRAPLLYVLVEVNEHMPRVHRDAWVHISEVDAVVENQAPLIELPVPPIRPEDAVMGEIIAAMIPDGATIQLGIGGVPNAVAKSLTNHKDLGVNPIPISREKTPGQNFLPKIGIRIWF